MRGSRRQKTLGGAPLGVNSSTVDEQLSTTENSAERVEQVNETSVSK